MRFLFLIPILLLAVSTSSYTEKVISSMVEEPDWASRPEAVKVIKEGEPCLELTGSCEISKKVSIPGFTSLAVDIRLPKDKTGRMFLKLLEKGGAEYITPTPRLKGTGDWEKLEFRMDELFVAPWSDDDNLHLDMPLTQAYFVFTADGDASIQLRHFRTAGDDPRKPTADYPLVKAWIDRLAERPKPAIPNPENPAASDKIGFVEQGPNITLKSDFYELEVEKKTGKLISLEYRDGLAAWKPEGGRWWSALTFDGDIIDNTDAKSFHYAWDAKRKQLRLAYMSDRTLDVILVITGTESSLRCKALVKNLGVAPIRSFRLPDGIEFGTATLKRMVLPRLGGVELLPGYFERPRRLAMDYPSDAFSDFAWAQTGGGSIAVYAVQDEALFHSSRLKLANLPDEKRTRYTRETKTFIGEGSSWISPTIVFFSGRDALTSYSHYWKDNGLDRAPGLQQKLGDRLFGQLRSSVLLKYDFDAQRSKVDDKDHLFMRMGGKLRALPAPILLHPVNYWNPPPVNARADGGVFDTNYPDFLPPREAYGGTQGFTSWKVDASWLGMSVMPYINPTCWDEDSASYRNFGPGVGVKNPDGSLSMGWGMVAVTQNHPHVQAKNDSLLEGFTGDHKVDVLFEDQVGARRHYYDFSPSATHPAAYTHDLIEHAKEASAKIPLMTERGFDMLVQYESGFCGIELGLSCTRFMKGWEWNAYYGEGNWRVFPIETLFAGRYAALYHHDLGQFVMDKADLSWCLAKGYNMTYSYGFDEDWLRVIDAFQKSVCTHYFGEKADSFEYVNDSVTKSVWPKVTVVANHSAKQEWKLGEHTLAKEGFAVLDPNGMLIGGVLTRMNGLELGRECIVLQSVQPNTVVVRSMASPDGPIAAQRLDKWTDPEKIEVYAMTDEGQFKVECTPQDKTVIFEYRSSLDGKPVKEYMLLYGG